MMKHFTRNLISLLLIFLIALPATAFADAAAAQIFYENAAKEYGKGNYGQAAELLYKAYVNDANLIYAYNRILALQADKQYTAALKELNVFENQMMKDPDKRFEDVPQIKSKLEDQVAASAVKDPIVKKDPVIKDPDVKDPDIKKDDKIVKPLPETGMNSKEILGITIAGAGIPVLAVGILYSTGIFRSDELLLFESSDNKDDDGDIIQSKQEIYEEENNNGNPCNDMKGVSCSDIDALITEDDEEAKDQKVLAGILIGVGSAMIIGGGVVYLLSGDTPEKDANASNFSFTPYVTTTGAGAGFTLDF